MDLKRSGSRANFYQQVRSVLNVVCRNRQENKEVLLNEEIQFTSPLSLDAPAGEVSSISQTEDKRWKIEVWTHGLTGSLGALPTAYTEWVIDRYYRYGDTACKAFIDIFTHRLQCLRYLAWEKYHYYALAEHRKVLPLFHATSALSGVLHESSVFADGRFASLLSPAVRTLVNLEILLAQAFSVPIRIVPFVGSWSQVEPDWCCKLGAEGISLASAPMLGRVRWEHQSHFLIKIGPVSQQQASNFFPGKTHCKEIYHQVAEYVGVGLQFGLELIIQDVIAHEQRLAGSLLGVDACLGKHPHSLTRSLYLDMESITCQRS